MCRGSLCAGVCYIFWLGVYKLSLLFFSIATFFSAVLMASKKNVSARIKKVLQIASMRVTRVSAVGPRSAKRVYSQRKFASAASIAAELFHRFGLRASRHTVMRDLRRAGWKSRVRPVGPRRHVGDSQVRLGFALAHRHDDPNHILFSDEKWIDCNERQRREWVPPHGTPSQRCREQNPPKLHVWGVMGHGVKELIFVDSVSRINAEFYIANILGKVESLLFDKCCKGSYVFQQDNARAHTSSKVTSWLQSRKIKCLTPWPPRSPDMSPIEMMWAVCQQRVDARHPVNEHELRQFWQEEWDACNVDNLLDEWNKRLEKVIAKKGGHL